MGEPEEQLKLRIEPEMSKFTPVIDSVISKSAAPRMAGLNSPAHVLAETVRGNCQQEEEKRGLHDSGQLPLRWRPCGGLDLDLTDDLTRIAHVYRAIPSGRLVLLGGAGSGKSMLTLRFVQDFVETRTADDPVPVIFSLASWDPAALGLRDWMIERLLRDHTGLDARTGHGATLAAALVSANRILPVLDGFDEIATGLHHRALVELRRTAMPWLLTSRPGEYEEAGSKLARFATVELTGLTVADLTGYLSRDASWAPVIEEVGSNPTGTIATVLRTPLMASLAHTVHTDDDPAALLDTTRFPTADAIEEHLLGGFVQAVYRDHKKWDADDAWRWLGHLARHLRRLDTNDLAWWELGNTMRRSTRALTVVGAVALVTAMLDWIVYLPFYLLEHGLAAGLYRGLTEGLFMGPAVGIAYGLVYGVMITFRGLDIEPSRVRLRLRGPRTSRSLRTTFGLGLAGGFVVGISYGLIATLLRGVWDGVPADVSAADVLAMTLVNSLVMALIFGLAGGLVLGVAAALESPRDISKAFDPGSLLADNRGTALLQAAVLVPLTAITIGIGGALVVAALERWFSGLAWNLFGGLAMGAAGGFIGALGYLVTFTAWGQWLILSRVWLPLTGKLPWPMIAFLEDAYDLGVLRRAGAKYQFRHERLRDHLADRAQLGR